MASGIRATVAFDSTDVCPIAARTVETGGTVDAVHTSVGRHGDGAPRTDFSTSADLGADHGFTALFTGADSYWYRHVHGADDGCPCETIGRLGIPVVRYAVDDGALVLVFHAADYDELKRALTDLQGRYSAVDVRRLVRSPASTQRDEGVYVDRGRLTARQLEVLQTAQERGYFDRPRRANATELAAELGIDPSTFSEHLAAGLGKLLEDVLERGR